MGKLDYPIVTISTKEELAQHLSTPAICTIPRAIQASSRENWWVSVGDAHRVHFDVFIDAINSNLIEHAVGVSEYRAKSSPV